MPRPDTAPEFELHVCLTCSDPDVERRRRHEGGGAALLGAIKAELATRPFGAQAVVLAYECLGACTPRGRVSISAEDRWGVVFGGLDERCDMQALGDYIAAWLALPWGEIPKPLRPVSLRKKVIGKLPPRRHDGNYAAGEMGGVRTGQAIVQVAVPLCRAIEVSPDQPPVAQAQAQEERQVRLPARP
ncbi:DUF1636 family protein [Phaeovulum sp.]|uniref:DUF1636 family protein n=1 Tax=Phaeovulum sp. TaxID=2934796 RepID=UPI0035653CF5